MDDKQKNKFIDKIDGLIEEFSKSVESKQRRLADYAKKARETEERISRTIVDMQESLDYLRVCVKYTLFDLEATRRENAYLRRLLNNKGDQDVEG